VSRKKVLNADNLDIRIGYNLKQARKSLKLSQTKAAEILGVRKGQISKYENGLDRISASNLYRLAMYYNKGISYFFRITKELEME
jgi:transcriptional regulator with XRE-family HTH domain